MGTYTLTIAIKIMESEQCANCQYPNHGGRRQCLDSAPHILHLTSEDAGALNFNDRSSQIGTLGNRRLQLSKKNHLLLANLPVQESESSSKLRPNRSGGNEAADLRRDRSRSGQR